MRQSRNIGWFGIAALALGGSTQSLLAIDTGISGQADIVGQGSATILLLAVGFLLVCLLAPGWLELVLMSPKRVGGIGAACSAAYARHSPVSAALAGFCNWWGWTATLALCATTLAEIVGPVFLPGLSLPLLASLILIVLAVLPMLGLRSTLGAAIIIAAAAVILSILALLIPIFSGAVLPGRIAEIRLTTPFAGHFGQLSAVMAGLYLVGYAAPAFEAALFYVGEMADPVRQVRRAFFVAMAVGGLFFVVLPVVWFCTLGEAPLRESMDLALAPIFAPLMGSGGKACAALLMILCLVLTSLQTLCGSPRTLMQLSEDGLAPRVFGVKSAQGVPVSATIFTVGAALAIVMIDDMVWLQGAANFAYLGGIVISSIAVWLLRRDMPDAIRPWRAPRGTIRAGLVATALWGGIAILGFEQFGLKVILLGLFMTYSGAIFFVVRKLEDQRHSGLGRVGRSLYADMTTIMIVVLSVDAFGYIVALSRIGNQDPARVAALQDIFIVVAILSISVGIWLPGRIATAAEQVSEAARKLATGTLRDFSDALESLGRGDLEGARLHADIEPLPLDSSSELALMANSFNTIQNEIKHAAVGLERARLSLLTARNELTETNIELREHIVEQERLGLELVAARDSAEAGERSKAEFLAMISHELRTPLNGVIGLAGLLLDGKLDPQARLQAKMLRDAGDHLLELINDLLDFTKLEAGRLDFEEISFELDGVVQSALDLVAARAHIKSLEIAAYISPDIPTILIGDPGRLRQVLINLLGNAIKFTENGSVTLEVLPRDEGAKKIVLDFAVADTGMGIRKEDLPHLFEEFSQLDRSVSRRFGGTGLGLAISRRLVARMGGDISVDSTLGQGSTFRFNVALKIGVPATGQQPRGGARLKGESVLVLHSNDAGGRMFARQIRSRGGLVHRAAQVSNGLELVRQAAQAGTPFHAVLIDHALPDNGAEEFARSVRTDPKLKGTRLILVSNSDFGPGSHGPDSDIFDTRLLKPVPADTLIYRLRGPEQSPKDDEVGSEVAHGEGPVVGGKGLRILVAEDNHTNQAVIRGLLKKLGYHADVVANGLEAVAAVRERPYDLVLMDVMMPEMDGITATETIRALPSKAAKVPIVALTADVSPEHHLIYQASGMRSVLVKPITLQALVSVLESLETEQA